MRHYSLVDQIIFKLNGVFTPFEKGERKSIALMRVNHSGEVCAQALYQGQALTARDKKLVEKLKKSAKEEEEHLEWCKTRLDELKGRPSLLNPIWKSGSFIIGGLAGLAGDRISLGFLAETEYQVTEHLEKHLNELPANDTKSRLILERMREDELRHATTAIKEGGIPLPHFIRKIMRVTSKVMTTVARVV